MKRETKRLRELEQRSPEELAAMLVEMEGSNAALRTEVKRLKVEQTEALVVVRKLHDAAYQRETTGRNTGQERHDALDLLAKHATLRPPRKGKKS